MLEKIVKKINKNEPLDYYKTDYSAMRLFLHRELTGLFKKSNNKKYLLELNNIIKYTNKTNLQWLTYKEFVKQPGFLYYFINNMHYFQFKNDFSDVIKLLKDNYSNDELFSIEFINEFIKCDFKENSYKTLYRNLKKEEKEYLIKKCIKDNKDISRFISVIEEENKQIIYDNIKKIVYNCDNILSLKEGIKDNNESLKYVNEYIDNNPLKLTEGITYQVFGEHDNITSEIILLMLVLYKDNVKYSQINYISKGLTSFVYEVGNIILKIQTNRNTNIIYDNPYINKSIVFKEIENKFCNYYIEISMKADTKRKVSHEQLYDLYKNIRDLGLIWTDVSFRNVGYLNDKLVIIDTDYIYKENEDYKHTNGSYSKEYEKKYRLEKQKIKEDELILKKIH